MSTPDNTEQASATSAFGIWTLLRIAGIIVGVATLLRLATTGFGVEYKEFFQEFLHRLRDLFELTPLLDPIERHLVQPLLDDLRGLGWRIAPLGGHWRPAFTLASLLIMSIAQRARLAQSWLVIPWGFLCTLWAAVEIGTDRDGFTAATSISVCLLVFVSPFFYSYATKSPLAVLWVVVGFFILAAMNYVDKFLTWEVATGFSRAAIFVSLIGVTLLALGLARAAYKSWQSDALIWNDPLTSTGVDILGVVGAALFIGWLMLK